MKKIIFLSLVLIITSSGYSQPNNGKTELNKEYYLKKRNQNNTTGHLLFWSGFTSAIVGTIIDQNVNFDGPRGFFGVRSRGTNKYKHAGVAIACSGLVLMVGSVPFFYFAVKNKRNALSLSFKNEPSTQLQNRNFIIQAVPSLTIKLSL